MRQPPLPKSARPPTTTKPKTKTTTVKARMKAKTAQAKITTKKTMMAQTTLPTSPALLRLPRSRRVAMCQRKMICLRLRLRIDYDNIVVSMYCHLFSIYSCHIANLGHDNFGFRFYFRIYHRIDL